MRDAPMQHSPKMRAKCRLSWCPKPKDSAAEEAEKSTISVEVAAAAWGWMLNSSSSGFTIMPPPMPSKPACKWILSCNRPDYTLTTLVTTLALIPQQTCV